MAPRTILGPSVDKLQVDVGVVLTKADQAGRRRSLAYSGTNTQLIKHVYSRRMNSVGRGDLVARQRVLVQQEHGNACAAQ